MAGVQNPGGNPDTPPPTPPTLHDDSHDSDNDSDGDGNLVTAVGTLSLTDYNKNGVCALLVIEEEGLRYLQLQYRNVKVNQNKSHDIREEERKTGEDKWRVALYKEYLALFPSTKLIGFITKGTHMLNTRSYIASSETLRKVLTKTKVPRPDGISSSMYKIGSDMTDADETLLSAIMDQFVENKNTVQFENYVTQKVYSLPGRNVIGRCSVLLKPGPPIPEFNVVLT